MLVNKAANSSSLGMRDEEFPIFQIHSLLTLLAAVAVNPSLFAHRTLDTSSRRLVTRRARIELKLTLGNHRTKYFYFAQILWRLLFFFFVCDCGVPLEAPRRAETTSFYKIAKKYNFLLFLCRLTSQPSFSLVCLKPVARYSRQGRAPSISTTW